MGTTTTIVPGQGINVGFYGSVSYELEKPGLLVYESLVCYKISMFLKCVLHEELKARADDQ